MSAEIEIFQAGNTPAVVQQEADVDSWALVASDVIKLATYICETEFVPKNYRGNAPATAAAILAGRELGLPPMTSLRHVHVVEGSPSLSAEYKRARVLAAGHEFDVLEVSLTRCRVSGRRRGSTKPPLIIEYTIEDARRAGLVKPRSAWETRPRRMLFARAGTELCDFMFADITNGLPTTELLTEGSEDAAEGYNDVPPPPGRVTAAEITSRRDQRHADTPPADPQTPAAPAGGGSPRATTGQVGIIQSLWRGLGYDDSDPDAREERLTWTAKLAGLDDLATTSDLTQDQAARVREALKPCKTRADVVELITGGGND